MPNFYIDDDILFDIVNNDFSNAVIDNDINKVRQMLAKIPSPIDDCELLQGLSNAIEFKWIDILKLLLANDRVREVIESDPNLNRYSHGEGNYNNILTQALYYYANNNLSLRIIDLILKLELVDVNKSFIKCSVLAAKSIGLSLNHKFRPYHGGSDVWSWSQVKEERIISDWEVVTKSPLYMACEKGDVNLVKRILREPNIDIKNGYACFKTRTSSNNPCLSSNLRCIEKKTPLQLAQEKKLDDIADLLKNYKKGEQANGSPIQDSGYSFFDDEEDQIPTQLVDNKEKTFKSGESDLGGDEVFDPDKDKIELMGGSEISSEDIPSPRVSPKNVVLAPQSKETGFYSYTREIRNSIFSYIKSGKNSQSVSANIASYTTEVAVNIAAPLVLISYPPSELATNMGVLAKRMLLAPPSTVSNQLTSPISVRPSLTKRG